MNRYRLYQLARAAAVTFSVMLVFGIAAFAQERRQGEPGQFDYYILALSWSPSYCEARQGRARNRSQERQCDGRPFSFVVHGLWPQYDRGFPSYCQVPPPRLDRNIVGSMLDLIRVHGLSSTSGTSTEPARVFPSGLISTVCVRRGPR